MTCPICSIDCDELLTSCGSCGAFTGFPNVRLAERAAEVETLDYRYYDAITAADRNGLGVQFRLFEKAVRETSSVVFAMNIERLRALATSKRSLYSNYDLSVRAQARRPAETKDDQLRRTVDAKLWGIAATEIRYGALSLDGCGLTSYGECHVTIRDIAVSHRSSVLERNSYDFLGKTRLNEETPLGFRASWQQRHKVAVVKCLPKMTSTTVADDFPHLLLFSGKRREDDEFVEVHVYGSFDFAAVESVVLITESLSPEDLTSAAILKEYAYQAGKGWRDV